MAPLVDLPGAVGCLEALRRAERRVVLVATGGGSAAIPALVGIPGSSTVIDEALVPYARAAVDALLGGPQESYCGPRASRRLAMAAWQRGRRYGTPATNAVGIACTASLATTREKRGEHRAVVAVQTLTATTVSSLLLTKGRRTRAEEERVAAAFLLDALESGGAEATPSGALDPLLGDGESVVVESTRAEPGWSEVLAGTSPRARIGPATSAREAIFPGSFDPLHDGHRAMARIAARITGLPVAWELSIGNVDKPALDFAEIRSRSERFAGQGAWLTSAPTFVEKLDLFPGAPLVVGADTYARLGDPRYYGGCGERAREAVERIARESGGLVVFGRARDGVFVDPSRVPAPEALRAIATFVGEAEFRDDVSSTLLRRAASGDGD